MLQKSIFRRFLLGLLAGLALAVAGVSVPVFVGALTPAYAQVSGEFQEALEQYGEWRRHPRFGDVWVPTGLARDWRPYEVGHWVYTEEWGWYWVSDDQEGDWGWVTYHYGRWAFDRGLGWFWVPGDEWAPAWVDWRYSDDYVGWAPLPPDELADAYEAEPAYWVFVPGRYMTAPRLRSYYVPRERRVSILGRTRIVNRTLRIERGRLAVNPGISPAFVAAMTRSALPTYRVQPRVLGSTQGVAGAVHVRPEDLRARRQGGPGGTTRVNAVSVQRTTTVINAGPAVPAPKALGKGEGGQLGSHPPRAAQGGVTTQPQTPSSQPPAGVAPRTGPAPLTTTPTTPRTGPAPVTSPTTPPSPTPGAAPSGQPPQAKPVRPVVPQTPPPVQSAPRQPTGAQPAPPPAPGRAGAASAASGSRSGAASAASGTRPGAATTASGTRPGAASAASGTRPSAATAASSTRPGAAAAETGGSREAGR